MRPSDFVAVVCGIIPFSRRTKGNCHNLRPPFVTPLMSGVDNHARTITDKSPPALPAPPEFPPVLARAARLPRRHVDADRGAGVAGAGADPFVLQAGRGLGAPVRAHAVPVLFRRGLHRLRSQAEDHPCDPVRPDGPGLDPGGLGRHRRGALLARGGPRRGRSSTRTRQGSVFSCPPSAPAHWPARSPWPS